jgi:hypothetical protein
MRRAPAFASRFRAIVAQPGFSGGFIMGRISFAWGALALVLVLAPATAGAQEAAPPGPYKPVAVKVPPLVSDPSLDAFRKAVAAVAQRRDRAALAGMVVAKGFFWDRGDSKGADDSKSGIDNLAAAFELDASDGGGWDALGRAMGETHAALDPQTKGVACAPPPVEFNDEEFEALVTATKTDPAEWGFTYTPGLEVHSDPKVDAPVVEKLSLSLVRVTVDDSPLHAVEGLTSEWLRVVTPSGKVGYVPANAIGGLVVDAMCYLKDASGWKITGIVSPGGGGDQH